MATPPDPPAPPSPPRPAAGGPVGPKMLACPACGASITLRALGQSVVVACPSCGSEIDVSRAEIRLIRKYNEQIRLLHIALGTRGKLRGQVFEVIGAMRRVASGYGWEEYLLFNPYVGFRWLVYDRGHWNFGQMIKDTSSVQIDRGLPFQGHMFRRFDQSDVVVDWVVGEFYWRVTKGERVQSTDYIAPPWMLSCERADGEITWTILEYIEPAEIQAAFHAQGTERMSLGTNQPNSASQDLRSLRKIALIAMLIAFLLQLLSAVRAHDFYQPVGRYELIHSASDETQVYGPYTFTAGHSVNRLDASAPLNNAWVELQGSLVNTDTGKSYPFVNSLQYYSGRDSDGSWSEGSSRGSVLIGGVPAGTYNLVVDGSSGDQTGRPVAAYVDLGLTHDVVTWRNFWIAILLIALYPLYLAVRVSERQRWADSPYGTTSNH